jgi:ubiquinone/menaquinone biosynthesis C-methylase UbiE
MSREPAAAERPHWISPRDLAACLELKPGMVLAEMEAGTGELAIPISRQVSPGGKVFAVDCRPSMLDALRQRLRELTEPAPVEPVEGSPACSNLAEASCDVVIVADLWRQLEDREAMLREARRVLKPGGRLAILEWRPGGSVPPGPPLEQRIAMKEVIRAVELSSWSLDKVRESDPHGYVLVFEPTDESVQS